MTDGLHKGTKGTEEFDPATVSDLSSHVISMVASCQDAHGPALTDRLVQLLVETSLSSTRSECATFTRRMMQAGISSDTIADVFIPDAAREIGERWCQDRLGFGEVTIGVARLQGLLRTLGPEWRADEATTRSTGAALVIVQEGAHHTLGATLLAGQLRRRGLSAKLLVDADTAKITQTLGLHTFDAILISASIGESLEKLRLVVESVRNAVATAPMILIGGTIIDQDVDVCALTGADLATKDIEEALATCGLTPINRCHPTPKAATE